MGIRTNDELGGTKGGDTTGTEITEDDGTKKRGLDVKIKDYVDLASEIKNTNNVPTPSTELTKISELKCMNETLRKIEFHLSILTGESFDG